MVRIFDLPPGGLMDGAVPTENSQILRKEFINADNNRKPIFNKGPKSEVTVTESESPTEPVPRYATPTPDEPAGSNAGGIGSRSGAGVN